MPSENAKFREKVVLSELEDEGKLIATIVAAHKETCNYTKDISQRTKEHPLFTTQLECPLHSSIPIVDNGNQRLRVDFSERFSPAIKEVVDFARRIPGFEQLSQNDQVTLLKAGVFEVLLVRLMYMFDTLTNTMLCLNGQMIKRESLQHTYNSQFLLDSLFEFADQLKILQLLDSELGLFCAVVVIASDRPGLHNVGFVEKVQEKLRLALKNNIANGHPQSQHLFQELMQKIPILRTLNKLHSEKLLPFKMKADYKMAPEIITKDVHLSQFDGTTPFSIKNYQLPEANKYTAHARSENLAFLKANEEYLKRQTEEALLTYSAKRPFPLCNEELASGVSSAPYVNKERKLDSPTDSGIDSGRELGTIDGSSAGSQSRGGSMCSSPRSSIDEKIKDVSSNEQVLLKQDSIEDMPVLKRALQAPPLNNANLLMNEAYKPHKKFRALRNSSPSGSDSTPSSTTNSLVTSSTSNYSTYSSIYDQMSLAKSHSTLVKTLSQGPQMTEQQLKCTDIIHNIIMNGEQASKYSHTAARSPNLTHEAASLNCPSSSGSGKGRYFGQYIPPPFVYNRGMAYSEVGHYQSIPPQITPPLKHSQHAHSSFNNGQPNSSNVISSYHHHHRHHQTPNHANESLSKRASHRYSPGGTPTLAAVLQLPTVSNAAFNNKIYGGKNYATSTKISTKSSAEANNCSKILLNYHLPQTVESEVTHSADCQPLNLSKKITSNHLSINGHHSHISTTTHKGHLLSSTSSQKIKMKVI